MKLLDSYFHEVETFLLLSKLFTDTAHSDAIQRPLEDDQRIRSNWWNHSWREESNQLYSHNVNHKFHMMRLGIESNPS